MSVPTGLSLVVPLYRDAGTVEGLVDDALAALAALGLPYEVLLIDDCSPDDSGERARALASRHPAVRALTHDRNRGLASAISTGVLNARHSHVLYTDGDHSYFLGDAVRFVAAAGAADLVIGIRDPRQRPLPRRVLTVAWGAFVRATFGLHVQDVNCSFKLFPRDLLDGRGLDSEHGFADAELLLRATERGMRIEELAVALRDGPSRPSNFLSWRLIRATVAEALRAREAGARAHVAGQPDRG